MLSIDITDKQVKLVRGTLSGNKIRVLEVETRDLTIGSVSNGYITDIPMVAGEITDIIATKNIKEKEAIVCINSGSILYKELTIPKPKKISNSAAIEAMILNTMGITKEYNISYSIIGETKDENDAPMLQILATACPQRMVDGYIRLFTQLGLNLKQINISNNCISRLILNTPKLESAMPLMLVQVDNDFVNINLYEDGQVTLNRYVRIDPYDYGNDDDYVNQAVYDNVFRTIQFISQRKDSKPLKEIMFYGQVRDFIALSNAVSSFNVPAHILNMPNNIVTFCDFDFSEYANAIGAFFKIRKDLDHVNLLDSSAVKERKGTSKFFVTVVLLAVVSAVGVAGVTFAMNNIKKGVEDDYAEIDARIHNAEMDARRAALNEKISVYDNINLYESNLKTANTLFEYLPKATTEVRTKLLEALDGLDKSSYLIESIDVSGYNVSVVLQTQDQSVPTNYVRNLIEQDYFEAIIFTGFEGEDLNENAKTETGQALESEIYYNCELTMRIKGGNNVELK